MSSTFSFVFPPRLFILYIVLNFHVPMQSNRTEHSVSSEHTKALKLSNKVYGVVVVLSSENSPNLTFYIMCTGCSIFDDPS